MTTSATLPHVGDGTQGAETLSEALGLRAYGGDGDEDDDEAGDDGMGDDDDEGGQEEEGGEEAAGGRRRQGGGVGGEEEGGDGESGNPNSPGALSARRRTLLTAQVVAAAASAVRTVLAPDPDSHENPATTPITTTAGVGGTVGYLGGLHRHERRSGLNGLASQPKRVLVPIVVLMPTHHGAADHVEIRPTRRTREAEASLTTDHKKVAIGFRNLTPRSEISATLLQIWRYISGEISQSAIQLVADISANIREISHQI